MVRQKKTEKHATSIGKHIVRLCGRTRNAV